MCCHLADGRKRPLDSLGTKLAKLLSTPNRTRQRIAKDIYLKATPGNILADIEDAFLQVLASEGLEKKVRSAFKNGGISGVTLFEQITDAIKHGVLSKEEGLKLTKAEAARAKVIAVDDFSNEELKKK